MRKYRRSLVSYLDILGFSRLIETKKAPEIADVLALMQHETKPDVHVAQHLEMSYLTFSDCTIRAVPIRSKSNKEFPLGILWGEILGAAIHTNWLLKYGYLLRGGLTVGDICIDGQTVFGPALVKSYTLESQFANYPRIVIDPAVFEALEKDRLLRAVGHDLPTDRRYVQDLVRKDADGLYFVDHLKASLTELDEPGQEVNLLTHHKKVILRQAGKTKEMNSKSAKYLWLATYHNSVVHELGEAWFKHFRRDMKDFLITSKQVGLLYVFK